MFLNSQLQNFYHHTFHLSSILPNFYIFYITLHESFFLSNSCPVLSSIDLFQVIISSTFFHTSKVSNFHRFWQLFKSVFSSSTLLIQTLNLSLFHRLKTSRPHSHSYVSQIPHFSLLFHTSPLHISTTLLKFLRSIIPRVQLTNN